MEYFLFTKLGDYHIMEEGYLTSVHRNTCTLSLY